MENKDKVPLTPLEQHLKKLLTNKVQFNQQPYTEDIFHSNLVLKIKYPKQRYIPRKDQVQLGVFIKDPPKQLANAYDQAFDDLYADMEVVRDAGQDSTILQLRNAVSFEDVHVQEDEEEPFAFKKVNTQRTHEDYLQLYCREQYNGILDAFIIQFNSLIYVLQHVCGFRVRTFLISEEKPDEQKKKKTQNKNKKKSFYLLISQKTTNLISAANKYGIKKQIDYSQLDFYLNDPTDEKGRPIKLHSAFKVLSEENPDQYINDKYVNRRMGAKNQNISLQLVINGEAQIKKEELMKYQSFVKDLKKEYQRIFGEKNTPLIDPNRQDQQTLTQQQINYLGLFNEEKKNNTGVHKVYLRIKKRRKYFRIMNDLAKQYGYKVYQPPKTFSNYSLANKKKKFFDRWAAFLFYKENVINPYGDLGVFNRMERIKLCYLLLREHIRVENLNKINCQLFAVSSVYEKFGQIRNERDHRQLKEGIKGGIDGKNLVDAWSKFICIPTDFKTCRNYLGQAFTYQILIKISLIYFFLLLLPFGAIGEVLIIFVIKPSFDEGNILNQFIFNVSYLLILVIMLNIFIARWQSTEQKFKDNYMESQKIVNFRYQFKGPYTRNLATDSVNEYIQTGTISSYLTRAFFFFIVLVFLGIQVGFYVGCRYITVAISLVFPSSQNLFNGFYIFPTRIFGYVIFFIINAVVYPLIIVPFFKFLTSLENIPTIEGFNESHFNKLYIFSIGLELIGPIDLIYIQPFVKTSCFSDSCSIQFFAYVYTRYMIIFLILLFRIFYDLIVSVRNISFSNDKKDKISFEEKLGNYLIFVDKQSRKKEVQLTLIDQTVALFLYSIFGLVFPSAAILSFLLMHLQYIFQRREVIYNTKRPICKSETLEPYVPKTYAILHWMIFFNLSIMFIGLEYLENLFQTVIFALTPIPSVTSILMLKIFTIFAFMIVYEFIGLVVREIVRSFQDVRIKRRNHKLQKILESGNRLGLKMSSVFKVPKPIRSIARIFNTSASVVDDMAETEEDNPSISSRQKRQ